jgi:uncharacterized protein DUF4440
VKSRPLELESLVRKLVETWNDRDEEGFAALFKPSAEYVTGEGERRRGRREIARLLREAAPGLHVVVRGAPSIECDAGSGTVGFAWTASRPSGATRHGRIKCVVARQDGEWLIETLHNDEDAIAGGDRR